MSRLPAVRGAYRAQAPLAEVTWFRVGGPAEVLFKPADAEDLRSFMQGLPADVPVMVMGVASNLLVRDGGVPGVVIRLGRGFVGVTHEQITQDGQTISAIRAGAGALGRNVALYGAEHGLGGLEFLSGIPGTVGGAVAMNAGAYGREVRDVLLQAEVVDRQGRMHHLTPQELQMRYRHSALPEGGIVTGALLRADPAAPEAVRSRIAEIQAAREASQPVRAQTGGSTFTNPPGAKAWELIDAAGCRGLRIGGAQMSEKHCNFMINTGTATAADLEALGEEVRRRVQAHSGVLLQWEIKRVGVPALTQGDA